MMKTFNPQQFWDDLDQNKDALWPVIVLDFNGVFDQYGGWNGQVEDYPAAPGISRFVRQLREYFKTVIVQSATMPIEQVEEWLKNHQLDLYIDYVTNHKPPAMVYVDDKAVTHRGNFDITLGRVLRFYPHWKRDVVSEVVDYEDAFSQLFDYVEELGLGAKTRGEELIFNKIIGKMHDFIDEVETYP